MATIGLSKPFYAIYAASGATVSYTSGGVLGKAVELSMELEGGDANILYADNGPAESATTFGGGTLTITGSLTGNTRMLTGTRTRVPTPRRLTRTVLISL